MTKKLRIGVLMGGMSIEREVSLNSGRTICDHLDTNQYDVIPIFQTHTGTLYLLPWRFLHRGKINDFVHRLADEAWPITWDELPERIDVLYSALHGEYGEDGSLQGMCEVLGIPYVGSDIASSATAIDKWYIKGVLQHLNVAYPETLPVTPEMLDTYYYDPSQLHTYLQQHNIELPVIVKPRFEGSSLGVTKVYTHESLYNALETAVYIAHKPQDALIQEAIEGMEMCQILIPDENLTELTALPPTEIAYEEERDIFDYEQKYMPGRAHKFTPARCSSEAIARIHNNAQTICNTLNLRTFVRIDYMLAHDGTPYVIDINTFPGTAPSAFPFLQAAEIGLSHTDVINRCIRAELYKQNIGYHHAIEDKTMANHIEDNRIHVAVLLGGSCHEREISLESGRNACYKLSPHKYAITPLFVSSKHTLYRISQRQLVRNTTEEIENLVTKDQQYFWHDLPRYFDFVFLGLHGGIGENGAVQGALDMLNMPYNGSGPRASALCMNKYRVHQLLQRNGFHVPEYQFIDANTWYNGQYTAPYNLPVVVKPHDDGSSVSVFKAYTHDDLCQHLEAIFNSGSTGALIEEVIAGMELTVGVIGNETAYAFPPSYAVSNAEILSMEEKFLPGAGENQTPAPLDETTLNMIRREAEQAYQTLGCSGYARIDCFYQSAQQSPTGEERIVFLEPNTLPALTPATCLFHQAAEVGLKPMDFFDVLVQLGQARHARKTKDSYHLISHIQEQKAV